MFLLFLIVLFIAIAIIGPRFFKDDDPADAKFKDDGYGHKRTPKTYGWLRWTLRSVGGTFAVMCFLMTSCFIIDSDKVGHLKRIYFGKAMPPGQIIANTNENGPQAKVYPPGFHLLPFIRVTHDIEGLDMVTVDQGTYGFLVAKDGLPMPQGQFIASAWEDISDMLDAMKFLGYKKGSQKGTKGPQLTVLPPGDYRINRYLFEIYSGKSTAVPAGRVAVIKSNVGEDYVGPKILPTGIEMTDLSVPIVPKGYRGVWNEVYNPGEYYLNKKAFDITIMDTRVQTWPYIGGYTRKWIDLTIGDDGKMKQTMHEEAIPVPKNAADGAVVLRVQGWDVFQDSRVQVQVTPENAPFVVASVGSLEAVENKIITPNYRSILRNVVSKNVDVKVPVLDKKGNKITLKDGSFKMKTISRPREVLDLLYHREELEKEVALKLIPAGAQAGLTVQWVRFGDPAVPPSLLIPGKRKQLAEALMATYKTEKTAQVERVQTEKERARADQQGRLMKSEIGIKVADNNKLARKKEGEGEKLYMTNVAKGQLAQANVLGKEKAFELSYIKEVLAAAKENPNIVKYPGTLVMGASALEGGAAILGANNLTMGMKTQPQTAIVPQSKE